MQKSIRSGGKKWGREVSVLKNFSAKTLLFHLIGNLIS